MICNYEGVALKSTLSKELTVKYAGLMAQLVVKSRGIVRTIDAEVRSGGWRVRARARTPRPARAHAHAPRPRCPRQDDLLFLRVRTKKHEVMVAPDKDYLLVVLQKLEGESH